MNIFERIPSEIRDGIEWCDNGDGTGLSNCECARCGSDAKYLECENCEGDGSFFSFTHDAHLPCSWCDSNGGAYHCIATPEYCNANPIPGREDVRSTALENWE